MDDADQLEQLAAEFAERLRAGERPTVEGYVQRHPELQPDLEELLLSVAMLERVGDVEAQTRRRANRTRNSQRNLPEQLGPYRIGSLVGRGGMGAVYEAEDTELKRKVALKLLDRGATPSESEKQRFQREAQLAAQLQHPNIVSVYGVGEDQGYAYFAMQFVDGRALSELIRERVLNDRHGDVDEAPTRFVPESDDTRLKHDSDTHGTQTQLELRSVRGNSNSVPLPSGGCFRWQWVVDLAIQAARAVNVAHEAGIVHRDIKPGNLLVEEDGHTWVADFGLAKPVEQDDITRTGDVLGTLRYMAPEQLDGQADSRTDIYSLGQTIYEAATLKPMCQGTSYRALLTEKSEGSYVNPCTLNPQLPRDLATIIAKAVATDPASRYQTSLELALDLQRLRDDRPIHARRVTTVERIWRWSRRNRWLASLGAITCLMLVTLPIVLAVAYTREAKQKQQTEVALNVVLEGFDELFRTYVGDSAAIRPAAQSTTTYAPPVNAETAQLLERMLVFYDRLAQANVGSNNAKLVLESARARRRVGELYQALGQYEKATIAFADATQRFDGIRARSDRDDVKIEMSRIYNALGNIARYRQDVAESQTQHELALGALLDVTDSESARLAFVQTYYYLAQRPQQEGRTERGELPVEREQRLRRLDKAIELLQRLLRNEPESPAYRLMLALCYREASDVAVFDPGGDSERAKAVAILQELVTEFPSQSRYQFELCETNRAFGAKPPQSREALARYIEQLRAADRLATRLAEQHPSVALYRIEQAHVHAHLGVAYSRQGDLRLAEAYTRKAMENHERVQRQFPGLAATSLELRTNDCVRLGNWLVKLKRWEEAIETLEPVATRLVDDLLSDDPLASAGEPRRATVIASHSLRQILNTLDRAYAATNNSIGSDLVVAWRQLVPFVDDFGPGFGPPGGDREGNHVGLQNDPMILLSGTLSYDTNDDDKLTRDECPGRMSEEWFRRADYDQNDTVELKELAKLFSR